MSVKNVLNYISLIMRAEYITLNFILSYSKPRYVSVYCNMLIAHISYAMFHPHLKHYFQMIENGLGLRVCRNHCKFVMQYSGLHEQHRLRTLIRISTKPHSIHIVHVV